MEAFASLAALVAIAVLLIVIFTVAKRGLPALNADLFTQVTSTIGIPGQSGGIKNAIIGTVIITLIATAISLPLGVLIAIFNSEFAPAEMAASIRIALNVLAGVPTIVIGVFVYGLIVITYGYSAYAAAVALAVVQVPIVARAAEEVLLLVPTTLREAGMALGATKSRTVLTVILPTAVSGIVTGAIVAVARAAGETAPLLFTTSLFQNAVVTDPTHAMATIPIVIFQSAESPSPQDQQVAWAAALVLLAVVLLGSIMGRLLSLRARRRIEQTR
jgi:phosphate transport system permease protein